MSCASSNISLREISHAVCSFAKGLLPKDRSLTPSRSELSALESLVVSSGITN